VAVKAPVKREEGVVRDVAGTGVDAIAEMDVKPEGA